MDHQKEEQAKQRSTRKTAPHHKGSQQRANRMNVGGKKNGGRTARSAAARETVE
jgi:hypothetical protein